MVTKKAKRKKSKGKRVKIHVKIALKILYIPGVTLQQWEIHRYFTKHITRKSEKWKVI